MLPPLPLVLTDAGVYHEVKHVGADFQAAQEDEPPEWQALSLSQTLIKACSPGVPDFYQGTELWDDNLVDPDNRRAVDFASRRAMLERISHDAEGNILKLVRELLASPADGRIKMYIIRQALQFRRHNPQLFAGGRYVALEPAGAHWRNNRGRRGDGRRGQSERDPVPRGEIPR